MYTPHYAHRTPLTTRAPHFRWINEKLYKSDGAHAHAMMREDPAVFDDVRCSCLSPAGISSRESAVSQRIPTSSRIVAVQPCFSLHFGLIVVPAVHRHRRSWLRGRCARSCACPEGLHRLVVRPGVGPCFRDRGRHLRTSSPAWIRG